MEIRKARVEDADELAAVHVLAWQQAYEGIVPQDHLDSLSVEKRRDGWVENIRKPAFQTWIAIRDDRLVGFISAGPSRDDDASPTTMEIAAIYVHPDHWGWGVGSALWTRAEERATAQGARRLTAWTFEANARALAFYRSRGCQPDGARRRFTFGGQDIAGMRVAVNLNLER